MTTMLERLPDEHTARPADTAGPEQLSIDGLDTTAPDTAEQLTLDDYEKELADEVQAEEARKLAAETKKHNTARADQIEAEHPWVADALAQEDATGRLPRRVRIGSRDVPLPEQERILSRYQGVVPEERREAAANAAAAENLYVARSRYGANSQLANDAYNLVQDKLTPEQREAFRRRQMVEYDRAARVRQLPIEELAQGALDKALERTPELAGALDDVRQRVDDYHQEVERNRQEALRRERAGNIAGSIVRRADPQDLARMDDEEFRVLGDQLPEDLRREAEVKRTQGSLENEVVEKGLGSRDIATKITPDEYINIANGHRDLAEALREGVAELTDDDLSAMSNEELQRAGALATQMNLFDTAERLEREVAGRYASTRPDIPTAPPRFSHLYPSSDEMAWSPRHKDAPPSARTRLDIPVATGGTEADDGGSRALPDWPDAPSSWAVPAEPNSSLYAGRANMHNVDPYGGSDELDTWNPDGVSRPDRNAGLRDYEGAEAAALRARTRGFVPPEAVQPPPVVYRWNTVVGTDLNGDPLRVNDLARWYGKDSATTAYVDALDEEARDAIIALKGTTGSMDAGARLTARGEPRTSSGLKRWRPRLSRRRKARGGR